MSNRNRNMSSHDSDQPIAIAVVLAVMFAVATFVVAHSLGWGPA